MNDGEQLACFMRMGDGDEKAFSMLFKFWYAPLCLFATGIVKNPETAEEVVQSTFVKIWENRGTIKINTSVKNYLFTAVRNRCLNQLEQEKIRTLYARKIQEENSPESDESMNYPDPGFIKIIEESIQSLPEKRREIFRLNREEGLKYREIAEKLNISLKTVEAQMGLALKTLREKLRDFILPILFLCFFKNTNKGN